VTAVFWAVTDVVTYLVLVYFILLNGVYLATSLFAFGALRRYAHRMKSLDLEDLIRGAGAPPITLVAPAYNEEPTCVESVRSLLTLDYPEYEILVVNDGSKDRTVERLVEAFNLKPAARLPTAELSSQRIRQIYRSRRHPNLWVLDKENGGKADALNAGINYCRTPLFCAMDADSLLERQALVRIVRPFLEDASTVAAGGILRIANGCVVKQGQVVDVRLPSNLWARFQVLEYLRAFLSGRMGWDALDATLVISGAFGMFRRSTVVDAGGYATDTVGEDMELVVRLHRHCAERNIPYKIHFVPDPVAWTECPESLAILSRQRDRWQRGLFQSLTRHKVMLLNPRYGKAGFLAFPYFFFLEMLGPVIEALGYVSFVAAVAMGRADWPYIAAFLGVAVVLGVALSVAAVALEELSFRRYPRFSDLLRLFGLAVLENIGYRQLSAWWRLKGTWSAIRKVEGWGRMQRKGFTVVDTPGGAP
jgi:cellulose synthase/poly-beta-1,6-N-acetylglucosamine synthase-like glycosyltransferase